MIITEPGIYDLPEDVYHGDPVPGRSLSSSVARKLLSDCPAVVDYEHEHGQSWKKAFDVGSAFHTNVLGKGEDVVLVERSDGKPEWNTDKVKAEVQAVREAGKIPLKRAEIAQVERMAVAVREHAEAGPLFAPGAGVAERSIFWQDERTGTWCRAMLDWLSLIPGLPPQIVDLKSTKDPSKYGVQKAIAERRYYQQDPWYRAAVASLGYDLAEIQFVFVFVGIEPPHLVTVAMVDDEALEQGMKMNEQALDVWADCQFTGVWPGYSDGIETISLPRWAVR